MVFEENSAPLGGGGVLHVFGPEVSENATAALVQSNVVTNNSALSGDIIATNIRHIRILNSADVNNTQQLSGESVMAPGIPVVEVLDGLQQTLIHENGIVVRLEVVNNGLCQGEHRTCSATLLDTFLNEVHQGRASFSGLRVIGKPDCCVLIEAVWGNLRSNRVEVRMSGCSPGQQLSRDGTQCEECLPGWYNNGTNSQCAKCPGGMYQDKAGQAGCMWCGLGHFSNEGASQWLPSIPHASLWLRAR